MPIVARGSDRKLTEKQQQVAALARQGFSNKEIARTLSLSEGSVKQHLYNVYRKLQISRRSALRQRLSPPIK
jgi:DNA-binding NarL/FixJ family response regulator